MNQNRMSTHRGHKMHSKLIYAADTSRNIPHHSRKGAGITVTHQGAGSRTTFSVLLCIIVRRIAVTEARKIAEVGCVANDNSS